MEKGNQRPKDIKLAYRVAYLVAGHIKNTLTEPERLELEAWKNESKHNLDLFAELTDEENLKVSLADYKTSDPEDYLVKSKEQLSFYRRKRVAKIWTYGIAASVAALLILLFYFKPFSKNETHKEIAGNSTTDLQPGSNQAILTLANGKSIILPASGNDSSINGQATIYAKEGELVYNNNAATAPEFHTLTIPRKGTYKLKLPDGTLVYLNAESSIRYPTVFSGNERKVTVTGETYFEVAPDKSKPFRVVTDKMEIEAIGTSFNVNAYSNEPTVATTLVEGVVQIKIGNRTELLMPGEQLQLSGHAIKKEHTDINQITAWKNNEFVFSNTPLDVIMRQLARWYDATIVYQDNVLVDMNATISRDVPLSRLLYLLEKTDEVHFKIEGTKIVISK